MAQVGLAGFQRRVHRAVGRVRCDIGEERLARRLLPLDESFGVIEEDVAAEPFDGRWFGVVKVGAVEVRIVPVVWCLPNAAPAMSHHLLESAVLRSIGIVVSQVPLAKHPGRVTIIGEDTSNRRLVFSQQRATHDRVPDARAISPMAGQQSAASWRACWRDMIVVQPHRNAGQSVDVRRLENRVSRATQVAIPLVVGHHEDNIGPSGAEVLRERQLAPDADRENRREAGQQGKGLTHWSRYLPVLAGHQT